VSTNKELHEPAQEFATSLVGSTEREEQLAFSQMIAPCLDTNIKNEANQGVNNVAIFSCMSVTVAPTFR
jgi:hypothetical protein